MQIKAEYINPSDNSRVILIEEDIDIISFSKIIDKNFSINSKNNKGNWNGVIIIYEINDATVRIDDLFDGDLRILVNSNDSFYKKFVQQIKTINEHSKNN
jgi:hypothetical protein